MFSPYLKALIKHVQVFLPENHTLDTHKSSEHLLSLAHYLNERTAWWGFWRPKSMNHAVNFSEE